jgi:HEAT repeat protein
MPYLIENIITVVLWLIGFGLALTLSVVLLTIQRRLIRQRYFRALDQARGEAKRLVNPLFGKASPSEAQVKGALAAMRGFRSKARRTALEEALLSHASGQDFELARLIAVQLGWIDQWIDILRSRARKPTGEVARVLRELGDTYHSSGGLSLQRRGETNFLERSSAAERLGALPTPEGIAALLAGTRDPHRDVEEVCIRNLGRLAHPIALPVLLEAMILVLEGRSRLSIRTVETALLQYGLADIEAFRPALEHANDRVRFFACDIIRRICDRETIVRPVAREDFSREMLHLFLERLWRDENADVRARSALVIGHLRDGSSPEILKALLDDSIWFVRLHACRAAANKFYVTIAAELARRITDPHWLVREACVRSLSRMEGFGVEQIINLFLKTEDRYGAEQIAEELQRSGILGDLLSQTSDLRVRQWTAAVARRLMALGKTSMLLAHLNNPVSPESKVFVIRELAASDSSRVVNALRRCSEADQNDTVRTEAARAFESGFRKVSQRPGR